MTAQLLTLLAVTITCITAIVGLFAGLLNFTSIVLAICRESRKGKRK